MSPAPDVPPSSFFVRHEFAIRRLHSLTGIVPLGAYMVVHLTTNATLLNGTPTFQRAVYAIHALGRALPIVEWGLILLPLLFHAIIGVWIVRTGRNNTHRYPLTNNRRYMWQRITGLIAFVFLLMHVWHLHGWFHFHPWVEWGGRFGFVQFKAYNAASSLALAMDGFFWPAFYLVGVWACVYHLANGLWTAGITWGLWITAAAQRRATYVCTALGIALLMIATGAWWSSISIDPVAAKAIEDQMYEANLRAGLVPESVGKRTQPDPVLAPELIPQEPIPQEQRLTAPALGIPGGGER
jgi:succinate dehydrogenase / fumarate reductase, cytochrome b subunit